MLSQFLINGFITGILYSLVAISFGITYNATRVFHIAYAAVLVAASFILYLFLQSGLPLIAAIPLTLIGTGLINLVIEFLIYRPMEKRRNTSNTILVASIGIFIVLTNLIALLLGNETKTFSDGITGSLHWGSVIITRMQAFQLLSGAILIILAFFVFYRTKAGLHIRAISSDPELYIVFGKDAHKLRRTIFFISGFLAGIISLLYSYDVGFDPYFGMALLLNGLVAMIIGGIGSYTGSLAGGILLGLLQSFSVYFFEARWESAITFVILLLVLILRPQGLLGIKQRLV